MRQPRVIQSYSEHDTRGLSHSATLSKGLRLSIASTTRAMGSTATHNTESKYMSQLIVTSSTVRATSGGILTFKKWSESQGFDTSDKETRKTAMKLYDAEKKTVLQDNRRLMGAVATDARFDVRKFKIVTNKDGDLTGYDISGRVPSKADEKRAAKAAADDKDAKIAALEAERAATIAKLAALGITPEELEKVPALA